MIEHTETVTLLGVEASCDLPRSPASGEIRHLIVILLWGQRVRVPVAADVAAGMLPLVGKLISVTVAAEADPFRHVYPDSVKPDELPAGDR